jgi:hypothetical protein
VNRAYGPYLIALERHSHVPAPSNDERPLRMFMTDYRPAAHKVERLGCQSPGRKLSRVRVPRLSPEVASLRLAAATCTSITRCLRLTRWTRCLPNEKVSLTTTLLTKLLTNPLA